MSGENTGLIQTGAPAGEGTMTRSADSKIRVVVVRQGVDPKSYRVPQGTLLGALANSIKAKFTKHKVTAGSMEVDGNYRLKPDDFIFFIPEVKNS